MAKDWASDVKIYAPDADDGVIAGIVRYCGIALQKVDSSLVSFSDPTELARVRNNFLKKKCGLTDSDEVLDAAIAEVGTRMKGDRTKNRVTVYYLLSDRFGMHSLFVKAAKATAAKAAPVAAAAAGLALVGGAAKAKAPVTRAAKPKAAATAAPAVALAAVGGAAMSAAPVSVAAAPVAVAAAVSAAPVAKVAAVAGGAAVLAAETSAGLSMVGHWRDGSSPLGRKLNLFGGKGVGSGLMWLLLALAALAVIWAFMAGKPRTYDVAAPSAVPAVAAPVTEVAIPEGAGIIAEVRDEKPLVKVYFATGKADVAPEFAGEAATMKAYLDAHAGSTLGVSGYNDPTGNAALNAALSKKRAEAVKAALVAATIPDTAIELIKPEAATDATVTAAEARRVEVYIK